jgi:hypothetical protein
MRNAPVLYGALAVTTGTEVTASVPQIRRTGCPLGCVGYHDHPTEPSGRCNFCTSLDWSAREGLYECISVCPLQAVAP